MSEQTKDMQIIDQRIVVQDSSEFSSLLDTGKFEQMWRIAGVFASSQLVPAHYQGKRENCFLGLQMAFRLGVDPMMLMQNTYIIGGRPGMESKMIIALINSSGLFDDPLEYEIEGTDPKDNKYRVRAYAVRKGSGKVCQGPWIDWTMVKAEGWDSKAGSKWKTIPGQMFCYRAAAFFGRLYCPERLLGMQTAEELIDVTPNIPDTTHTNRAAEIAARFTEEVETVAGEIPMTAAEVEEVKPEEGNLAQEVFALLAQHAKMMGETPDDMLDKLTNGKIGCQIDLEDKPAVYLNDIKLMIENAIAAEASKEA